MEKRMFARLLFVVALLAGPATAGDFEAAPMKTSGATPTYPRLVKFPDAAVLARVNAQLEKLEKLDRKSKNECLAQVRAQKQKPTKDNFSQTTSVAYLSPLYLSIDVSTSYYCGGPYPNDGIPTPVAFELRSGAQVDWTKMFEDGFLPRDGAGKSALADLYRATYRKDEPADDECRDVIKQDGLFSSPPVFRLDAEGIIVQPDFPHVIAACADPFTLPIDALATYLKDTALTAELRGATTKR